MKWVWASGILVLMVTVLVAGMPWRKRAADAEGVRTVAVTRGSLEITAAGTGTFELQEYVDVGAQISGQLKAVPVKLGETVRRGQLVAVIDDTTTRARLAQTEAMLASAQAQIAAKQAQAALARAQRDRNIRLVERGFLSAATQETAETGVISLDAEVASLRAQAASLSAVIAQVRTELTFAEVRAPMSGTVVAFVARPGQTLNAAQQSPVILRIGNIDSLGLVVAVSEADVVHVRPGMTVRFQLLGAPERQFSGHVKEILPSPRVVNSVVFYDVLVQPSQRDELFRIGMTAQAFFLIARHDCMLKIPRAALPVDLRPPQTVRINLLEAGRTLRPLQVEIAAADDTDGGVPCDQGARAGLVEGARVAIPSARSSGKKGAR
jgi:macrolide-specific efflux system membrane fusion protein